MRHAKHRNTAKLNRLQRRPPLTEDDDLNQFLCGGLWVSPLPAWAFTSEPGGAVTLAAPASGEDDPVAGCVVGVLMRLQGLVDRSVPQLTALPCAHAFRVFVVALARPQRNHGGPTAAGRDVHWRLVGLRVVCGICVGHRTGALPAAAAGRAEAPARRPRAERPPLRACAVRKRLKGIWERACHKAAI